VSTYFSDVASYSSTNTGRGSSWSPAGGWWDWSGNSKFINSTIATLDWSAWANWGLSSNLNTTEAPRPTPALPTSVTDMWTSSSSATLDDLNDAVEMALEANSTWSSRGFVNAVNQYA